MPKAHRKRQLWIYGVLVVLNGAIVFTLGSLHVPLHSGQGITSAILVSLSLIIGCAFVIFVLILLRSLVRLGTERRSGQMGSRFKVKWPPAQRGFHCCRCFHVSLQLRAGKSHAERMVSATLSKKPTNSIVVLLDDLEKAEFVCLSYYCPYRPGDPPTKIAAEARRVPRFLDSRLARQGDFRNRLEMAEGGRSGTITCHLLLHSPKLSQRSPGVESRRPALSGWPCFDEGRTLYALHAAHPAIFWSGTRISKRKTTPRTRNSVTDLRAFTSNNIFWARCC